MGKITASIKGLFAEEGFFAKIIAKIKNFFSGKGGKLSQKFGSITKSIQTLFTGEGKFAQIINNPNADLKEEIEVSEVESTYKDYYYLYKDDKFEEAVTKINEYLPSIQQSELLPKFELLKALAIGKYKDKEAYKKSLEFVSVSYGNTEQGKRAKAILDKLTSK